MILAAGERSVEPGRRDWWLHPGRSDPIMHAVISPTLRDERFFHLAGPPVGGRARLCESDEQHVRRVLRLAPGDHVVGGDGCGRAWHLRATSAGRSGTEFEVQGEPWCEPAPGEPGSHAARIEVALALPRAGRSEAMLERLTQLGVWSVRPLVSERVQGPLRDLSLGRSLRLERCLREACKQSRRLWTPSLGEPVQPAQLCAAASDGGVVVLDPAGEGDLLGWAREHSELGSAERPVTVVVGPEGGLTAPERTQLVRAGALEARLGQHILRIETAAEAACAILGLALAR